MDSWGFWGLQSAGKCQGGSKYFSSHIKVLIWQLWRTRTTSQGGKPPGNHLLLDLSVVLVDRQPGDCSYSSIVLLLPVFVVLGMCYTERAPNAWQRRGTQKTGNTYIQPNRPNRQTSQTKHQALPKGQPGRRITPINTAAVHASAQQQPTIITHTRQGHHQIFSANAARCEAQEQYRRAG